MSILATLLQKLLQKKKKHTKISFKQFVKYLKCTIVLDDIIALIFMHKPLEYTQVSHTNVPTYTLQTKLNFITNIKIVKHNKPVTLGEVPEKVHSIWRYLDK